MPAGGVDRTGHGRATWGAGTVVDLGRVYEARARVEVDGQALPALARRLPFERVPLVLTTADRLLRIQFALPEQELFSTRHYSVEVYLAAPGQAFPGAPSFSILSQEIEAAYPNRERVWELPAGSGASLRPWVVHKIDRMELPPGADLSIRRQAFEISTIFAGYPRVRVVVRGDEDGVELDRREGRLSADLGWSELIEKVTNEIRKSAGDFVPVEPVLPEPEVFDPLVDLWGRYRGLAAVVMAAASEEVVDTVYTPQFLVGVKDGFFAGLEGDREALVGLKQLLTSPSPVKTGQVMLEAFRELRRSFPSAWEVRQLMRNAYARFQQFEPGPELLMALGVQYYYHAGFFVGFAYELALSTVVLGAVTGGVVTLLRLGLAALQGTTWVANLTVRAAAVLRALGYALQGLVRVGAARALARTALTFFLESGELVGRLAGKYTTLRRIAEALAEVLTVSRAAAGRALYWLTIVDTMSEEAGARLVFFVRNQTVAVAEQWLSRWTALRNGKRAVKEAFEAYAGAAELAVGAHDALVTASDVLPVPASGAPSWARRYAEKYQASAEGDRVESSLTRLRQGLDDSRFDDEAVAETVRFHGEPVEQVPHMSDEAVEGTARVSHVPCVRVAALGVWLAAVVVPLGGCGKLLPGLVQEHYPDLLPRFEQALSNLTRVGDVAADEAFARLLWAAHHESEETARAVIRAASFPNATPESVAEYLKAVDWMRDPADPGSIISGLLDPAEEQLGSSVNIKRVGNLGAGSLAEGWEPVAVRRLIEGGSPNLPRPFTRGDIESFGRKLDVSTIPPGMPGTIEADCLLKDGTFFDMKHSLAGDPKVTDTQINTLVRVLLNESERPIQRAVFVVNAPVGQAILTKIRTANDFLKNELNVVDDLIYIIEDLGGFPLP